MEGALLDSVSDKATLAAALRSIAQLSQDVATLRGEVATLRRDNLELRQQAGYWKSMHTQAC